MGLFSKKRQRSPSGSASGQPCAPAAATGAYELGEQDPGRLHGAAPASGAPGRGRRAHLPGASPSSSSSPSPSPSPRAWQSLPGASCCWWLPAGPRPRRSMCWSMRRSMQRVMGLFSKKRQRSPSGSASGQPCAPAAATSAYELGEQDPGRLHRAAARGDLAWLRRQRLRRGGIDGQDQEKRTPLHVACADGHVDVIRCLVQENCRLNLADDFKSSPLMTAVQCQQEKCVAILLQHGADPNLADADGNTALHLAVVSPNTTVAGLLLEHNANINAQNREGYTPLNLAVSKHDEEMVEFLHKKGTENQRESKLLAEDTGSENTEDSSAGGVADKALLSSSCPVRTAAFTRAALAQDREGALPVGGAEQEEDAESPGDFEDGVAQLQQKLASPLKKQSMSEASREVTTMRYHGAPEKDNLRLQKELARVEAELRELEEQHLQPEHCVRDLKTALDNKEREVIASTQKLQDLLLASSGTNATIKQLEDTCATVHNRLEDLITSLQTAQAAAEDHLHQQMQKQNVLPLTSKDSHSMWEEHLKSRSHLEERVAQLDREKAELLEQCETERKKVKKLVELKRPVELRLDQEMKRNIELQKDYKRLKKLLSRATKNLRAYEEREMESQLNLQGEMKNRYSETVNEVGRLRTKVGELSQQLERESKKCMQLEAQNQDLREELSTVRGNHEKLEKSKCQLKEEVANLKHHLETNMVDRSQLEQYKREMEERAGQEIRQKLQEVNLFLQTQAASQDRSEQIRGSHLASLRNQLQDRIRDLECALDRIKNREQDSILQKESMQAEVERYKELYLEEVKIRRRLADKLERANERLAEANAKLLQERHRSRPFMASSIVSGGPAASPVLYSTEVGPLGNHLALNRSLSLGGSFLSQTGNALSSRNRVEAYVAKLLNQKSVLLSLLCSEIHDQVRRELDEKITKELGEATAELETGSTGSSPMVSGSAGSSRNVHVDQDPLSRAIQEYRDVLTKNYLI
ncbi:ankyrin repeat domain-containing protein 26-like [Aquila chrysaetos chrysaetos]|uniref:ankyrin repeat domain-containing protein 26-like n=1 Tax=Aquila chrysaetos chrysaetos TaxID=223781 RepID=UPI0011772AF9|nr:ankyrin repeat domain-containing protein 26-like [Aquila chrysaetos chrysaetos]